MRPTPITNDNHTLEELEQLARNCKEPRWARRLRAVAMVLRGSRRGAAAEAHGVDVQTLRDWIEWFNDEGPEGLRRPPAGGRPCRLTEAQLAALRTRVDVGPDAPGAEALSRFRLCDIAAWIEKTFGVKYSLEGVRKLLRRLGFRHLSPRPLHPKADLAAQEAFRSNFSELANAAAGETAAPIEIWFQDESRVGQQGMLSRVWARKGHRPRIPRDRRFGYCYLFSAACPARKTVAGHICDRANTDEMNRHLQDISEQVAPGSHAVVVLDGAGWHKAKALETPGNLSLLFLPPYSPELNPMENVFQYLKANQLANRVFQTVLDVQEAVEAAWTLFAERPNLIQSTTQREWAKP